MIVNIDAWKWLKKKDENSDRNKKNNFKSFKRNFIILSIPIISLGLYFYVIGRSRYFVRSDVVVRKSGGNNNQSINFANLLGAGNQGSLEDARFLRTYLESPQVLEELEDKINFREAYKKSGLDRYAGISNNSKREELYRFFRKQISVSLNESSGLLRIRTLAFKPDTSLFLNEFLITQAEEFINELNQNVYKEQLKFAKGLVDKNAKLVENASKELEEFQTKNRLLDVKSESLASSGLITALEKELAEKKVQLASLKRIFIDNNSPEVEELIFLVEDLKEQIKIERQLLVSPKGKNLTKINSESSRLISKLNFASDLYKSALTAYEKTRVDSLQQQRFMAIVSKPIQPESQWRYWRHKGFLTCIAILLVGYALTKFILGMADSHNN